MRLFHDYTGRAIRLTEERLTHVRDHPEMRAMEQAIGETLAAPTRVITSRSDADARLYYRYYEHTPVDAKYLCVVVKDSGSGPFVLTAYLTDTLKKGELLWPTAN